MRNIFGIAALLVAVAAAGIGQTPTGTHGDDITGMYSFLHEGEFVEIEVDGTGKVTGLVSRFKDENQEKSEFVDQFFDQAKLDGTALQFRTKPADGIWFEFSGTVERGSAKTRGSEGYWSIKGVLIQRQQNADGKISEKAHELTLKSFPEDTDLGGAKETQDR